MKNNELIFGENESELKTGEDFTYDLTPYHFNMDVEGLVRRFEDNDVIIPSFQRNYVWTKDGASMFIDSVLRGLPTPSFFFYEESPRKYLVIDGQQRLLTLYYYMKGVFPEKRQHQNTDSENKENKAISNSASRIKFTLSGRNVHNLWAGKMFSELSSEQQKRIKQTYIYIINLKQTSPAEDNSSMYLVFERINTGSTRLNAQQIRLCVSHGDYAQFLSSKSQDTRWSSVFGLDDITGSVSELILRFISLFYSQGLYKGSMKVFLDKKLRENSSFEIHKKEEIEKLYDNSFLALSSIFDSKAFSKGRFLIGYYLLISWIALANIVNDVSDINGWIETNKESILNAFILSKTDEEVNNFITDTRRASNSEILVSMIKKMTSFFRGAIDVK